MGRIEKAAQPRQVALLSPPIFMVSGRRLRHERFFGNPRSNYFWRLNINCNNGVGAGFPRPIALVTDAGGENPPLRCCCFIYSKTIIQARVNSVTFKLTRSMEEPMRFSASLILTGLMVALSACYSERNGRNASLISGSPAPDLEKAQSDARVA